MEKETKSEWEKETGEKETKAEWLERRNAFKRSNPYIKHACVNRDPSCSNDGVWDQADMNNQPLDQNVGEPFDQLSGKSLEAEGEDDISQDYQTYLGFFNFSPTDISHIHRMEFFWNVYVALLTTLHKMYANFFILSRAYVNTKNTCIALLAENAQIQEKKEKYETELECSRSENKQMKEKLDAYEIKVKIIESNIESLKVGNDKEYFEFIHSHLKEINDRNDILQIQNNELRNEKKKITRDRNQFAKLAKKMQTQNDYFIIKIRELEDSDLT